jgi:hypothetical protein
MAESDTKKVTPLVVIDRVTYKKLKVEIKSETHAKLTEYVAFYRKATGDTKASDGASRRPAVGNVGGERGGGPVQT